MSSPLPCSQCNADTAFDEYFRFWKSTLPNQTAPFLIGAGCSVATEPMLTVARFWHTMQVPTNAHTLICCIRMLCTAAHPICLFPPLLPSCSCPLPPSACVKVSYASSAPHLSDNSRFPYHLRVKPSEISIHKSQGILVAQFGWEEVTWIVQSEELFVSVS